MFENISYKKMFLILALLGIVSFFLHMSMEDANIMEARNFVTAREMVEDGNWIVTTMNGNYRFEKPPLPTWFTAIAYKIDGGRENIAMLRAPAAFLSIGMVFLFFGLSLALTKNKSIAFVSSVVLTTSFLIMKMARTGSWDIYTNIFMVGALYFLLKSREDKKYSYLAGAFMGLSIMSKGPVSVFAVFIPFIISYMLVYKVNFKKISYSKIAVFLLVSIVVGGTWYAYVYGLHSDVIAKVAKIESTSWINRHKRPFWYYYHFSLFSGVWFVLGIGSLFVNKMKDLTGNKSEYKFVLFWTLISLLLLSLMPEKKERYLLPVVIPMALLIGQLICGAYQNSEIRKVFVRRLFRVHIFIMGLLSFLIPILLYVKGYKNDLIGIFELVFVSAAYIFFLFNFIKQFRKIDIKKIFVFTAALMAFSNIFFTPLFIKNDQRMANDYPNLYEIKNMKEFEGLKIYAFENVEIENIWRVGRKVEIINRGEEDKIDSEALIICYEKDENALSMEMLPDFEILKGYTFYENRDKDNKIRILRGRRKQK